MEDTVSALGLGHVANTVPVMVPYYYENSTIRPHKQYALAQWNENEIHRVKNTPHKSMVRTKSPPPPYLLPYLPPPRDRPRPFCAPHLTGRRFAHRGSALHL